LRLNILSTKCSMSRLTMRLFRIRLPFCTRSEGITSSPKPRPIKYGSSFGASDSKSRMRCSNFTVCVSRYSNVATVLARSSGPILSASSLVVPSTYSIHEQTGTLQIPRVISVFRELSTCHCVLEVHYLKNWVRVWSRSASASQVVELRISRIYLLLQSLVGALKGKHLSSHVLAFLLDCQQQSLTPIRKSRRSEKSRSASRIALSWHQTQNHQRMRWAYRIDGMISPFRNFSCSFSNCCFSAS
jgi:hypothetical protein